MAEKSGKGIKGFLTNETAGMPNWVWISVIAAGIGIAYFLPKLTGGGTSSQTANNGAVNTSGLGLAIDPTTGLPYAVEGLVPSGGLAGAGTANTVPPAVNAPSIPTELASFVRGRFANSQYNAYDTQNPQGIPIRQSSTPDSPIVGYVPFASLLQITGAPVQTVGNFAGTDYTGSDVWYPVAGGYVSAYDLQGAPTQTPVPSADSLQGATFSANGVTYQALPTTPYPSPYQPANPQTSTSIPQQTAPQEPAAAAATGGTSGAVSGAHFNYPPVNYRGVRRWPYSFQNLHSVASQNGTSFERLMQLNPQILRSNRLEPGEQVRIA